jgi:hypothetical protein
VSYDRGTNKSVVQQSPIHKRRRQLPQALQMTKYRRRQGGTAIMVQRRYENYFGGESPRHALTILFDVFVFVALCNMIQKLNNTRRPKRSSQCQKKTLGGLKMQRRR